MDKSTDNGKWATFSITAIRMAVGWYFLLEGFSKLTSDGWSTQPFLEGSSGFISEFYHWMIFKQAQRVTNFTIVLS